MPAYDFTARFAPAVKAGMKRQTIRAPRPHRLTKHGDILELFGPTELLLRRRCTAVVPVSIAVVAGLFVVKVDGVRLTIHELDKFAREDGFRNAAEFMQFFQQTYGLPQDGLELIKW